MKDEEDVLTPEQIAAATAKVIPEYYAYYDGTNGDILSVSNTRLDNLDNFFPISYEVYEQFVTGQEQFKDWVVNRTKNSTNEFGVEIVSRIEQTITFRNNMFEVIEENDIDQADLVVHSDCFNKKWIFILSDTARQKVYDNKIATKNLNFFITYSKSFNFLIRTINIPLNQIMLDKVEVDFETTQELKIETIKLSTKHTFDSYKLVVWEYKQDDQKDKSN